MKETEKYIVENYIADINDKLIITKKGKFISDGIIGDLFGED